MSWSSQLKKQQPLAAGQRPNLVTLKQLMGGGVNPAASRFGKLPGSRILNSIAQNMKPGALDAFGKRPGGG